LQRVVIIPCFLFVVFYDSLVFSAVDFKMLQKKYHVPNVSVAYIDNGNIEIQHSAISEKFEIDEDLSLFQIASLSKTLFAVATIRWAQINAISLYSTLQMLTNKYGALDLPNQFLNISLRQLLSHTSGISELNYIGYSSLEKCPSLAESIQGVKNFQNRLSIDPTQQGRFLYSGGNYTLLQQVIEQITQLDFNQFMGEYLFDKWGMGESFSIQEPMQYQRLMSAHNIFGKPVKHMFFCEQAAAGIVSSIEDMGLFIKKLLEQSNDYVRNIMLEEGTAEYGLGIEIEHLEGLDFLYHLGANFGWRSGLYMIPKLHKGLVVLTNSESGCFLTNEIVQEWIQSLGLTTPSIIHSAKNQEKLVLYGVFSFLLLFFIRATFLLYQVKFKIRQKQLSWNRFVWLTVLLVIAVIWYTVFYTSYLSPSGWIIGSFLPYNFLYFSVALFAVILVECIHKLYPKTTNNRVIRYER